MSALSSEKFSDLLISTTSELETQLISLAINKNGQTEKMIDDIQIIINDFRAKFLSNLISLIQLMSENKQNDKNFDNIRKALEENINKYKQKNLLFQMKNLVNSKIKAMIETLNSESNDTKKQTILSQLALLNDSLQKIENTLNESHQDISIHRNSFDYRLNGTQSQEIQVTQANNNNTKDIEQCELFKMITPIPQRLKQQPMKSDPDSNLTPLLSESREISKKIAFKTPNNGNPVCNSNPPSNHHNPFNSECQDQHYEPHTENNPNSLNSFNKTEENNKYLSTFMSQQNAVTTNIIQNNYSLFQMFDTCLNSIYRDQIPNNNNHVNIDKQESLQQQEVNNNQEPLNNALQQVQINPENQNMEQIESNKKIKQDQIEIESTISEQQEFNLSLNEVAFENKQFRSEIDAISQQKLISISVFVKCITKNKLAVGFQTWRNHVSNPQPTKKQQIRENLRKQIQKVDKQEEQKQDELIASNQIQNQKKDINKCSGHSKSNIMEFLSDKPQQPLNESTDKTVPSNFDELNEIVTSKSFFNQLTFANQTNFSKLLEAKDKDLLRQSQQRNSFENLLDSRESQEDSSSISNGNEKVSARDQCLSSSRDDFLLTEELINRNLLLCSNNDKSKHQFIERKKKIIQKDQELNDIIGHKQTTLDQKQIVTKKKKEQCLVSSRQTKVSDSNKQFSVEKYSQKNEEGKNRPSTASQQSKKILQNFCNIKIKNELKSSQGNSSSLSQSLKKQSISQSQKNSQQQPSHKMEKQFQQKQQYENKENLLAKNFVTSANLLQKKKRNNSNYNQSSCKGNNEKSEKKIISNLKNLNHVAIISNNINKENNRINGKKIQNNVEINIIKSDINSNVNFLINSINGPQSARDDRNTQNVTNVELI